MIRRSAAVSVLGLALALPTADAAPSLSTRGLRPSERAPAASVQGGRLAPSERFAWPVTPHHVVRRFEPPASRWGPRHRGVDLRSASGTDVRAPAEGVVTFSGVVAGRGVLSVQHPQGFSTTYEPVSDRIASGTRVKRGQTLAHLDSGHCPGAACLHWGYRLGKDAYRDPLTLVRALRPVLLPPHPQG